MGQYGGDL